MDRTPRFLLPNHLETRALDRLVEKRRDVAWLARQMEAGNTRFVPVWKSKNLFDAKLADAKDADAKDADAKDAEAKNADAKSADARLAEPLFLSPATARAIPGLADQAILLGAQGDHVFFAVSLTDEAPPAFIEEQGHLEDLRRVAPMLDEQDCALLALARTMVHWHQGRRFCGDCGSPTVSRDAGFMRSCTAPDCGRYDFPRTDPAIIVLVTAGDRCLLGRQATWPAGLRSTLAGFVEPGETLEGAVVREVREEAGIEVRDIHYRWSQPWPFPTSLMLGFTACARGTALQIDEEELEEARWFSREEIRSGILDGSFVLPSSISIALRLIREWYDAGDCGLLEEIG